jgi:hypothetical protein
MSVQKFFNDLYGDLRDRRLLPVVAVLLAALVAVPFLLGGGEDPAVVPTDAAGSAALNDSAAGARQLEPVVLAEAPELREYEKRLAKLQSRNPFKQQASSPPAGSEEAADSSGSTGTPTGSAGSAGSAPADSPATPTDSPSSTGNPTGGGGQPQSFTITYEIDVKAGEVGNSKKQKDVELLDYLPDRKHPVVQFVGVTPDVSQAVFVVSASATNDGGDGKCVPNKNSCEFLALRVGEEQRFVYEPNGRTYRIKLSKITEVKRKDRRSSSAQGSSAFKRVGAAG